MKTKVVILVLSLLSLSSCLKKVDSLNEDDIFSSTYDGPIWFSQKDDYIFSSYHFFRFRIKNYQLSHTLKNYNIVYSLNCEENYLNLLSKNEDVFTIRTKKSDVQDGVFNVKIVIISDNGVTAPFCYAWQL